MVVARLRCAPAPAQALYARLLARRPGVFWLDTLDYPELPDVRAAADTLEALGLAWRFDRTASPAALAEACTGTVLREACRTLGRPVSGRRVGLVARCSDAAAAAMLRRPALRLRHRGLVRALLRVALLDGRGSLDRLVLARLGHTHPARYHPTGGTGLFPDRASWHRYEAGLRLRQLPCPPEPAPLFTWLEQTPLPPPWRRRVSGRRHAEAVLFDVLRAAESGRPPDEAAADWRRMLDARLATPGPVVSRLALALERAGQPDAAARLCERWLPTLPPAAARTLAATARRVGRRSGRGHRPLKPLRRAPVRRISLAPGAQDARRPRYRVGARDCFVEAAVVAWLATHGRLALHGESSPWSTLFGVLFRDALFAPVPGMLPGPMLRAPLDLGTPGFRARRRAAIEARLALIRCGRAPALVAQVVTQRGCEDIRGVHWRGFPPGVLLGLARLVPGPALAAIMEAFVDDWRGARRGLPDLIVLPGRAIRLDGARPGRLAAGLLLAEVKGPGDALRPAQRVWIDRLLDAGVPTEVWEVRPSP